MLLTAIDLIFAGVALASQITLYPDAEFPFPSQREAVVEISTHREWWREEGEGKCSFKGLMVPFVRDWEEPVPGDSGMVRPPEPEKTAGHAFIINEKICQDKPVEQILRAGYVPRTEGYHYKTASFGAFDMLDTKPDARPKWFQQVLQRIDRVSATDASAKTFMLKSGKELERVGFSPALPLPTADGQPASGAKLELSAPAASPAAEAQ